jgi:uncharacterized protein (TIGR02145 family)
MNKTHFGWLAAATSCLVVAATMLLFPNSPARAQAAGSDLNIKIPPVVTLSINSPCNSPSSAGNDVTISLTPKRAGAFSSCPNIVTVGTNTPGFQLLFKASNANLVNTTASSSTIPSSANATPSKLAINTWGYALPAAGSANHNIVGMPSAILNTFDSSYTARTNSSPIPDDKYTKTPLADSILKTVSRADSGADLHNNQTTIYYGAAADMSVPAGKYKTTVTYTVIGEEIPTAPPTSLAQITAKRGITTLQDLDKGTCAAADWDATNGGINDNNTVVLVDIRNDQPYHVRKLADKKCWMIDNLKLELGVANADPIKDTTVLEPTNTDVLVDTEIHFTKDITAKGAPLDNMVGNFTTSDFLTRDGTRSAFVSNYLAWRQVDPGNTADCANNTGKGANGEAYNPISKTKCGYLYNFFTTSASTAPEYAAIFKPVVSSICPAGWRLPTGRASNLDKDSDYQILDLAYGGEGAYHSKNLSPQRYWLPSGAFMGVFSGSYYKSLISQGAMGHYWGSTTLGSEDAYKMYFYPDAIDPGLLKDDQLHGLAVRCVISP